MTDNEKLESTTLKSKKNFDSVSKIKSKSKEE